jgi:AcrR family transcriptional regulator
MKTHRLSPVTSKGKKKKEQRNAAGKPDTYHHGDLRSALIETALEMLETQSPNTLSLRELAKRAGVSQAAPYRHFKDKEALLAAISQQAFELKLKYMTEAMQAADGDPLKTYFACGLAYFRMGHQHPQHFKLMFSEASRPENHPDLEATACLTFARVTQMVKLCQDSGLIGPGDPYQKSMQCWATVHGFTILYVNKNLEWLGVHETNAEQMLRTLMSQHLLGEQAGLSESNFGAGLFSTPESSQKRLLLEQAVNASR